MQNEKRSPIRDPDRFLKAAGNEKEESVAESMEAGRSRIPATTATNRIGPVLSVLLVSPAGTSVFTPIRKIRSVN